MGEARVLSRMASTKNTRTGTADKARELKALVARSNAYQQQEEQLTQALFEVRKERRALATRCPHPIEMVKFHTYVPGGPDVRGNCEICYALRHVSDYSKLDRRKVSFEVNGQAIAGEKLVTCRKSSR